jgi:hypothetical protein
MNPQINEVQTNLDETTMTTIEETGQTEVGSFQYLEIGLVLM